MMSVNKTENMENNNNISTISNINNSTNSNNISSPITTTTTTTTNGNNNVNNKQRSDNPDGGGGGPLPYCFLRGSDPRAATCRGKLQNRRCKLNQEINKELRLRAGAENLYKATTNRKLRETVALELSFVNSNLQLLKEQMSELNSSVEIYQNDSYEPIMPMIPLGLKETKEVNFMEPFSDFILEHYSENANYYEDAIADIVDTRQGARTPTRDTQGVSLLFRYYNLLYYVERRFFPPDRSLGVYFEWYDSLTGVPSCQRTVAFEKACILFNLGGIYTQIGAKHDRTSEKGLDAAVDSFLRAAGIFKHIHETFTNAPSMDLKPQVLEILVSMMLAQARECLYEKLQLQIEHISIKDTNHIHRDLSGEAAQLTDEYNKIHSIIQTDDIHTYIPECWTGFVSLKSEYYKSLSHYHKAKSISVNPSKLNQIGIKSKTSNKILDTSIDKNNNNNSKELESNKVMMMMKAADNFIYDETILDQNCCPYTLKLAHIKEALACLEEAQRLQRMCRDLKSKTSLTRHLKESHLKVLVESDFMDDVDVKILEEDYEFIDLQITACSKFTLSLTGPDFTAFKVEDPFKKLGPIAIFSAKRHWTVPRQVRLQKGTRTKNYHQNNNTIQQITKCKCKRSDQLFEQNLELQCEVCLKYTTTPNSTGIDSSNQQDLDQMLKTTIINNNNNNNNNNSNQQTNQNAIESYGFHIRGDSPVIISNVEMNSLADLGGIKEGDFIVEISGIDVKWYTNRQVSKLIQNANMSLDMKIITPMDRNYLKPVVSNLSKGSLSTRSIGSSSGVSSGSPSPTGTTTSKSKNRGGNKSSTKSKLSSLSGSSWNPFRRSQSVGNF